MNGTAHPLYPHVPDALPIFTTPTLDFESHVAELEQGVYDVYTYRDSFWNQSSTLPNLSPDELVLFKENHVKNVLQMALVRFNTLTRPPMKRRQSTAHLQDPISCTSSHSFDPTLSPTQKAYYHYLRGKLLNVLSHYDEQAEMDLVKAIKLDPMNVSAWNMLGEVLWKKNDLDGAKKCFEYGLKLKKNADGLVKLAVTLRMIKTDFDKNIQKSIELCKEAITMDTRRFDAWYGLGTSYLKLFFDITRNQKDLQKALAAYNNSEPFLPPHQDPDLYFNRASIHLFLQSYNAALKDYTRAEELDPPGILLSKKAAILDLLKKHQQKMALWTSKSTPHIIPNSYHHPSLDKMSHVSIEHLNVGIAHSKYVVVKLVDEIKSQFPIPRLFIGTDAHSNSPIGVAIFNLAPDAVKCGDTMTIHSPHLLHEDVSFGLDAPIDVKCLRCDMPHSLIVNNSAISQQNIAYTLLQLDHQ